MILERIRRDRRGLVRSAIGGVALLVATATGAAQAQIADFPIRPVNLTVPFPPGGAVDQAARLVADAMHKVWRNPIVVLNQGGAGGGVAMASAARAPADGYNLLAAHPSLLARPEAEKMFGRRTSYDRTSFAPLALLVADPLVVVVRSDAPWKTYEEFVAAARSKPDTITYASSGAYGPLHLPVEILANAAGIKLRHVPFGGGGPALTAVLSDTVAATTAVPGVAAPHIKSGALRALVTTGTSRSALLPEVPTAAELGYKDVQSFLWVGLFAPAATDPALAAKIRADIGRVMRDQAFLDRTKQVGLEIVHLDGPAFTTFLDKEEALTIEAIKRIGKVE